MSQERLNFLQNRRASIIRRLGSLEGRIRNIRLRRDVNRSTTDLENQIAELSNEKQSIERQISELINSSSQQERRRASRRRRRVSAENREPSEDDGRTDLPDPNPGDGAPSDELTGSIAGGGTQLSHYNSTYYINPSDSEEAPGLERLFNSLISKLQSYHQDTQAYDGVVDIDFEQEIAHTRNLKNEITNLLLANWNAEHSNNQRSVLTDFLPDSSIQIVASSSYVILHVVCMESVRMASLPVNNLLLIDDSVPPDARIREWIFKLLEIYEDDSSNFIEFCNRFCIDFPTTITSGEDMENRIMNAENLSEALTARGVEVAEEDVDRFETYLNTVSVRTEDFRNKVNSLLNDYTLNRLRTDNAITNVESNVDGFFENISNLIKRLDQITSDGPDGLHQYDGSFGEIVNRVEIGEILEEIMKCLAKQAGVSFDDVKTAYYYGLGNTPRPDKPFYEIARRSLPDLDAFRIPDFDYNAINSRARMETFLLTLGRTYKDILIYALIEAFKKMLMELIKSACSDGEQYASPEPLPESFTDEDYVLSLENMLSDLDSLVPFDEWCALFIGKAKNETLLMVLRILELKYKKIYEKMLDPSARGVRKLFLQLGRFSDTSFCSAFYGNSVCLDRDEILRNRMGDLLDDSANNNLIQFLNDIKSGKNFNLPAVSDVQKASNDSSLNDKTMQAAFEKTMSAIYDSLYSSFDTNIEAFKNIIISNESTLSTTEEGNSVEIKRSCLKGLRNKLEDSRSNFFFNEYSYDDGSKYKGFSIKVDSSFDELLSSLRSLTSSSSSADTDSLSAFASIDLGSIIDNSYIEIDYIVKSEVTGTYTLVVSNADKVLFVYNGKDNTKKQAQKVSMDSPSPVIPYKTTNYEKAIKKAYSDAHLKIENREGDEPVVLSEAESDIIFKNMADQSYPGIVSFVYSLISKKMSSSPFFKNITDSLGSEENTTVIETLNLSRKCNSKSVLSYSAQGDVIESTQSKKISASGSNKEKLIKSMKGSLSRTTVRSYVYDYFLRSVFTSSMIREDEKSFLSDAVVNIYKTEIKRDIINNYSSGDKYLRGLFITDSNEELDELLDQEIRTQLTDIRKVSRESFEFNKEVPSLSELMVKELLPKRNLPLSLSLSIWNDSFTGDEDYMFANQDTDEASFKEIEVDNSPIYLEKYIRVHTFAPGDVNYTDLSFIAGRGAPNVSKLMNDRGSFILSMLEFRRILGVFEAQDKIRRLSSESSLIETLDDVSFTSTSSMYIEQEFWNVSLHTAKKICKLSSEGKNTNQIHDRVYESHSRVKSGPTIERRENNIKRVLKHLGKYYNQYKKINLADADYLFQHFFYTTAKASSDKSPIVSGGRDFSGQEVQATVARFCFAKRQEKLAGEINKYRAELWISYNEGLAPTDDENRKIAEYGEFFHSLTYERCPPTVADLEYLNKPIFKKIEFCYRLCVQTKESEKKIRLKNISIDDATPSDDLNGLIIDKRESSSVVVTPKFMMTGNDREIAGAVNEPWVYSFEEKHGENLREEDFIDTTVRWGWTTSGLESNISSIKNNYEGKFSANSSYDDIDDGDGEFMKGSDPRRNSKGNVDDFRSHHSGFGKEFAQRVTYLTSEVGFFNMLSTIFSTVWPDIENPDNPEWFQLLNRHPENELDTTDAEVERYNAIKDNIIPKLERLRDNPSLIKETQEGGFIRELYYELRDSKERGSLRELRKPYLLKRKSSTPDKSRFDYGARAHLFLFKIHIYLGIVTDLIFETNSEVRRVAESNSDFLLLEEVSGPASLQAGLEESIESSLNPSDLEYEYDDTSPETSSLSEQDIFFVNSKTGVKDSISERAYQVRSLGRGFKYPIPIAEERMLLSESVNTSREFFSTYGDSFDLTIESTLLHNLSRNKELINFMYSTFPLKELQEMINIIMFYSLGIQKGTSAAFSSTRFLLKTSYDNVDSGGERPSSEITKLGGEEGVTLISKQMSAPGADLDVYKKISESTWDFLKKAAIEAPKKILMDMAENSDPNIMISKRIKDGIKLITPASDGSGVATDTAEAVDNAADTVGGNADGLVDTTKKISSVISKVNDIPIAPISFGLSFWVPPTPLTQAYIMLDLGDTLSEKEQRRRKQRKQRASASDSAPVQQSLLEELEIVDKTSCD